MAATWLGYPEICGDKPQNMYVIINKICENMCFIILAEIIITLGRISELR